MGNSSGKKYGVPGVEWRLAGNENGLDLYQRSSDGVLAERRRISLDPRFDLQKEETIYAMRRDNSHGYVRVYQVKGAEEGNKKQSTFCQCAENIVLHVYSERIENRLSDLPQLPFSESLNLLWQATKSFHHLYEEFGPFHINGELIGVNSQRQVRVWLNENWALNHPSHQISALKVQTQASEVPPELRNEAEMVRNLLQVMQEKTEHGQFPQKFSQDVYEQGNSFRRLKRFLSNFMNIDPSDQPEPTLDNHHNTVSPQLAPQEHQQQPSQTQNLEDGRPVFGEKINGSIILPPGYRPQEPHPQPPPTVRQDLHYVQEYRPNSDFRPPQPEYRSGPLQPEYRPAPIQSEYRQNPGAVVFRRIAEQSGPQNPPIRSQSVGRPTVTFSNTRPANHYQPPPLWQAVDPNPSVLRSEPANVRVNIAPQVRTVLVPQARTVPQSRPVLLPEGRPLVHFQDPAGGNRQFVNPETTSSFPRFKLINEGEAGAKGTAGPELSYIRAQLRQDISQLSSPGSGVRGPAI